MRRAILPTLIALTTTLLLWEVTVRLTGLPPYLLPSPVQVAQALQTHHSQLLWASGQTLAEIVAGFTLGASLGILLALTMAASPGLAQAIRPILLISQVIPIFALAPILTLWLGYGMAPKIVVTALICFFPVASAFLDGLSRGAPACLDLAKTMGASGWSAMWHLRIPMALPMLASGLGLASVYAPIGAVIGEWVGGSEGLGAVMIHANGRMRIDLAFAALTLVTVIALGFHGLVRWSLARVWARYL